MEKRCKVEVKVLYRWMFKSNTSYRQSIQGWQNKDWLLLHEKSSSSPNLSYCILTKETIEETEINNEH